jgi:Ca2+-binding EF-hand superfamily protein
MIRKLPALAAAAVLASALAATAAFAQQQERVVKMFTKLDKNGDKVIEKVEYDAVRIRAFKRLDANDDGRVTTAEVEALAAAKQWPEKRRARMIKRIGITSPQGVTQDEYLARKSIFERIDADGDGKVTLVEVETYAADKRGRKAMKRQPAAAQDAQPAQQGDEQPEAGDQDDLGPAPAPQQAD